MSGCKSVFWLLMGVMGLVIAAGGVILIKWVVAWFDQHPMVLGGLMVAVLCALLLIASFVGSRRTRNDIQLGADIANQGGQYRAEQEKAMSRMGGAVARMFGQQERPQLPPPSPWQVHSPFPQIQDAQFEDVDDEPIA